MIECLQKQIAECHAILECVSKRLDDLKKAHGTGPAKATAELGKFYLTVTKLLQDNRWGDYKPYVPSASAPKVAKPASVPQ